MSNETRSGQDADTVDNAADIVASVDTGARNPVGPTGMVLIGVALLWSLFQLWYSSPLPFMFGVGVFDSTEARSIHLAFAVFLTYTAYPAFKGSPRDHIPLLDWLLALVAAYCASYLFLFKNELADRPGAPIAMDVYTAIIGVVLLLEATRRALGPPLMVVCIVFLGYTFFSDYMPDVLSRNPASLNKAMSHQWLSTEGVFGVALGVSTSMVFMFVLFGALLEKAGAGNYFIRVAFSMMGHMRGGPAKAAVVSSALTGMISGSSIANVVTTGTFTIPLMKKVGFSAEKAGAVEVASSTNGQLTPPIMGAAAFLMVEYLGISLVEVMKHAVLPAFISYVALVYIVHLEACKLDLKGLPRKIPISGLRLLGSFLISFVLFSLVCLAVYYAFGWMKGTLLSGGIFWVAVAAIFVAYVGLLWVSTKQPPLETSTDITELPDPGPTVRAGLHYLVPVFVLVWCLMVERLSPGLSAFWATVLMMFIVVTQKPLAALLTGVGDRVGLFKEGARDLFDGLVSGARNMIGIGVATAAAGVVVGTITLMGLGQVMTEFIEVISGGNLMLILVLTAVISLLLGMGLPTTANYIVVSSLMAPVIVSLGAANGLLVPLVAVHMFVFYFGILADDTPPVGLAAFAAAAISGGDPIKTGIQGFMYDIRTAILPFLFIFNTDLLLIDVHSVWHAALVFVFALMAMLTFASATQGFLIVRNKIWESLILLLVAFTIFRPGYWMDQIVPPLMEVPASRIFDVAGSLPDNARLRVQVKGETLEGDQVSKAVMLPLGAPGSGEDRLVHAGLELIPGESDTMVVDNVVFGSTAERLGIDFDWAITAVILETEGPPKELFYIPAFVGLLLVWWLQRRRQARTVVRV
ncbi:MAG: TRAP transporter permease [Rhodospirillum sp.]|nr:TRAP transporter permease [Rhodospirillum sp.]MCF8491275.1 TRAP transporter permease [Rhodospirillum sp.]MCF8501709.1 TRAP transporter permease [Rhodospirillum sp.]